ncbi:hypothetical protein BDV26DRAFT_283301 [Aspergillus bertholletiae]|uniref:LPXTG-motif cell wall anchor domain protein n=1 Tax=Aspergillus bertholletiae TaxID=1226010 RepID=A0A5N7B3B7_9EURO|nr:hypothetical protein BDV26DRAFT_283301 [Aspergillus bertholletiae]
MQMSHDLADGMTPASALPPSAENPHSNSRPQRRQTVSAVYPTIHATKRDAPLNSARISRASVYGSGVNPALSNPTLAEFPARQFLPAQQPSHLSRLDQLRPGAMFVDDPRDAGTATALTSAGTSDSPTTTTPTTLDMTSSPSRTSGASVSQAHTSVASAPRLPQSRFNFEYHLPHRRRTLASHSSVIDTPSGLNPTPTPQRNLLYDRPRRSTQGFNLSHGRAPKESPSLPPSPRFAIGDDSDSALAPDLDSAAKTLSPNATKRRKDSFYAQQTLPSIKRRMPSYTATYTEGTDRRRTVNGVNKYATEDGSRTPVADDARSDIFLNIARTDSSRRESLGRSELRRSRMRMSGSGLRSSTSRVNEQTSSPDQHRLNTYESPLHSNNGSPSQPRSSLAYSYSASAHPLDDHSRSLHSGIISSSKSALGVPRSRLSHISPDDSPEKTPIERRGSLPDPRTYRHSTLSTIRSSRQPSSSEVTERPRAEPDRSRQDGTESTLSTTAPSTVWDELEDLKSRIRKLELTGKLPPSSQEAISSASAERPRTATTTVTTVSSSPKRGRNTSTSSPGSDSLPPTNPVHPLLQSALSKAKTVLNKEVYIALEATATDAIALSTCLSTNKAPSGSVSIVNGYGPSDRLSRRKADSVCRGLTELCLALSDEQLRRQQASSKDEDTVTPQSTGADDETLIPTTPYRRSTVQEPEGLSRRQSTRAGSRRSSFANPSGNENGKEVNWSNDTISDAKQTQSPSSSLPTSRLSRLASLRAQRLQTEDEPTEHRSPHGRSVSRSMTDISNQNSAYRAPARQRFSQGFSSSQAPQPQQDQTPKYSAQLQQSQLPQPRTPTASQSGIPLRRTLMTPATSRSNIQAGSRRYGLPSGISTSSKANDDAPISPRQDSSQTRIIAPSAKLATSYTPISRPRTNSFGTTRRFGIRQRPMAISDGAVNSFDDNID